MGRQQSVAPKERINIKYKPDTGDAKEEIELPFRMLVLGDFTQQGDDTAVEDREKIDVNKDNFNSVLREQGVTLSTSVPDVLTGEEGRDLNVELKFESMRDFGPDRIAQQVPELAKLLKVRSALEALKGPLGNMRKFRGELTKVLEDKALVEKLMSVVQADGSEGGHLAAEPDPALPSEPAGDPADGGSGSDQPSREPNE